MAASDSFAPGLLALGDGGGDEEAVDPAPAVFGAEPWRPWVPEVDDDDEVDGDEDDSDVEPDGEGEPGLEGFGAEGVGIDDGDEGGIGICGDEGDWLAQAVRSSSRGATPAARAGLRSRTDAMFMLSCLDRSWRRDLDVRACAEFHSWT